LLSIPVSNIAAFVTSRDVFPTQRLLKLLVAVRQTAVENLVSCKSVTSARHRTNTPT